MTTPAEGEMDELPLLNGPNLGILGYREPEVYGTEMLADMETSVAAEVAGKLIRQGANCRSWIEVLISNVWARESVFAPLSTGLIAGLGTGGHRMSARALPAKASSGAWGAGKHRTTADVER